MSDALKIMLENIEQLSTKEKDLAAHCLLTALNSKSEDNVDSDWLKLAESRSSDLESGKVNGLSWEELRSNIFG
ncbi:addiction module protein [Alteromonas sp. ASW11-130]|uniref:addiction module protein n=1 Tax=Alteromonas sp. ASW11-130 TaxID=3015775 RepID=UPI002241C1D3|nr:addiction module protein [Alteromonas sp. ASW11-130]MCW8092249.1 addiction module protein [Alteromonas sp. ASW11-130]